MKKDKIFVKLSERAENLWEKTPFAKACWTKDSAKQQNKQLLLSQEMWSYAIPDRVIQKNLRKK